MKKTARLITFFICCVLSSVYAQEKQIFTVVEQQPEFAGGYEAMQEYIATTADKRIAKRYEDKGTAYIQFVVNDDGSISDVKTIRGFDTELDKEAERIVASMPKWIPGKQNGKAVNVRFVLPVKLYSEAKRKELYGGQEVIEHVTQNTVEEPVQKTEEIEATPEGDDQVYTVVEQAPEFEGGFDAMKAYINNNANKKIRKKYLGEGTVYLQFIVQKDGSITDVKTIRGVAPEFDAEAERLVSQMPKWRPGIQNGKRVKVRYVLLLRFRD